MRTDRYPELVMRLYAKPDCYRGLDLEQEIIIPILRKPTKDLVVYNEI
jgi:hypothetical protein